MTEAPSLPYPEPGGESSTSGWAGSEASHQRALAERDAGVTAQRHRETLRLVGGAGLRGITVAELRGVTGWHHGQASSALSALHKEGRLARLHEKRGRCHIYVLPLYREGRPADPPGRGDRTKMAFIAGYQAASEGRIAQWEAEIAWDLWMRGQRPSRGESSPQGSSGEAASPQSET